MSTASLFIYQKEGRKAYGPYTLEEVRVKKDAIPGVITPAPPTGTQIISEGDLPEPLAPSSLPVEASSQTISDKLSEVERAEKERLEAIIDRNVPAIQSTLDAILMLHDKRLYREEGTWKEYCQKHWGKSRGHGYRIMNWMINSVTVSPLATLENEYQSRQLNILKTEGDKQFAAVLAVEIAKQAGIEKPTSREFRAAAETVQEMHGTGYVTIDDIQVRPGEPMPAAVASGINKAVEIIQRQKEHINQSSPYVRLEGGTFEGCIGEVGDWLQQHVNALGGLKKVKVLIYVEKPA